MATGKNTVCTPPNGTSSRLLPFISHCSDSFTTWRTIFIKQERSPTHRTLHETFGARHPSSVTPLTGRASFPPGEAKRAGAEVNRAATNLPSHILDGGDRFTVCTLLNGTSSKSLPLGVPRGEAGAFSGSSEPMKVTEEGWRQPKYCLHFVRWYQPQIIADYFPLFSFIPHMEKVFIKQAPFSTHRTLHENFGARHPSSVFFVNRFRSAD